LPTEHQIVQTNHATYHLASLYCPDPEKIPNMVLIGLPNLAALERALAKIKAAQITHYAWHEPDFDLGFTSITTAPISGEQRKALANYRLYPRTPVVLSSTSPSKGESVGSGPAGRANVGECADASSARA